MTGKDACQYNNLKQCSIDVAIFSLDDPSDPDILVNNKCIKRKVSKQKSSQKLNI